MSGDENTAETEVTAELAKKWFFHRAKNVN